ncbi:10837_t:CDS:10 [Acaulospora colombiana]|uniref:10837_t:CDS:1 n=1 Tax=Acaulospora colombiana TaxID=27376 RepID=A0ACA9K1A1_9GLOM|nr:10837_t:CDS:10 [Acaulospora colombiana]
MASETSPAPSEYLTEAQFETTDSLEELTEIENADSRERLTEAEIIASTYLYRNESIKILALNILKQSDEIKFNDITIPEQKPCICCKGKILSTPPTPITILTCGHVVHRTCVEKFLVNKPDPICPDCGNFFTGSEPQFLLQANEINMAKMEVRPSKKPREDEKEEKESGVLKRLIKELSADISEISEEGSNEKSSGESQPHNFLYFFSMITHAESKNDTTNREVISRYFDFGKALKERHKEIKKTHNSSASRALLNLELPFLVVYQVMNEEAWIAKETLRQLLHQSISAVLPSYTPDSDKHRKLLGLPLKFYDAFEGVCSLRDFEVAGQEEDLPTEKIENNLRILKGNLKKSKARYAKSLRKCVGKVKSSELSWRDPLASQVLSSEMEMVKQLPKEEYESFMEPVKYMQAPPPSSIKPICDEFVSNYDDGTMEIPPQKLSHVNWWERGEVLRNITVRILETLGDIWKNPAFSPKFAKTQSEGTYVTDIIVPIIRATLKDLPIGKSAYISTAERQSVASKDRRGERGKRPDIMFIVKHEDRIYELIFAECSRIVCGGTKEEDDRHKTQLETRQLTENETRQYIISQWISEDFLASDLKPSKVLQPATFLDPQFTFLEKFLEKRRQRQVVRWLLNQGLLPSNAIKTSTYILDFAVLSNHHLEIVSNAIQENLYRNDTRKKSLSPQTVQVIPTSSAIPQEFMRLLESEIFILADQGYQHVFNPQCFANSFGESVVDFFDIGRISARESEAVVDRYCKHMFDDPTHQSKQFKSDLIEHFGCFTDSNNMPYTTTNTASSHHKAHQKCVQDLIKGLQPISGSVNKYLETTYPVLYSKMKKLDLGPNVPNSFGVFPTVAVNYNIICQFHRDMKDHRNSLCVVCPLGKFKGGELVFPELKLVVHVKQGQAVAFRSNLLIHGNLPIVAGTRHSVVFYIHNTVIKQKRKFGSLFADYELDWDNSDGNSSLPKYLPPTLGSGDNTHKPLEDEEIDEFLDLKCKERVSEEIIQIIKEKKLRDQEVSSGSQDTSPEELISPPLPSIHNENSNPEVKLSYSESKSSANLLSNQKIPYNQKVERGLRHELFICTKENNNKSSKVFDIQIPEFTLETILTGSSKVTSQNIVDLFRVAMKVRQKESLCWYCYYKAYENRVSDVKSANDIDDQSARTIVYNEIKLLLPDITDVNLHKITSRAKKVYVLYEGIGIDKISQVTYSASAISSLKDIQIQNIINDFSKKSIDTNSQKVIGVTNCHAHMPDPSSTNDISNTKVNLSPVSVDLKIKASEEAKKVLPETEINVLPSDTKTNVNKPLVSRPPISILPDDPKEKQKHVIKMALERFPVLSLKYSNESGDYFNSSEEINHRVKKELDILCRRLLEYNEKTFGSFMLEITKQHEERVEANKKLRSEVEEKKIELQQAEKYLEYLKSRSTH